MKTPHVEGKGTGRSPFMSFSPKKRRRGSPRSSSFGSGTGAKSISVRIGRPRVGGDDEAGRDRGRGSHAEGLPLSPHGAAGKELPSRLQARALPSRTFVPRRLRGKIHGRLPRGIPRRLVRRCQILPRGPSSRTQFFPRQRLSIPFVLACAGLDLGWGSSGMVSMVLPLLDGSSVSRRRAPDRTMEGHDAAYRPGPRPLRGRRPPLSAKAASGPPPLGLRFPAILAPSARKGKGDLGRSPFSSSGTCPQKGSLWGRPSLSLTVLKAALRGSLKGTPLSLR